MIGRVIWAKNIDRSTKKWKKPPSHWKIKCLFLDYIQLLMIGRVIWAKNVDWNAKKWKRPLSHQKIKSLFLDYVQLLMIGRVIWANNVDQNRKKWKRPPKSSKNKMFVFGLHSTSDDRPSNLSKKMLTKTQKNEKGPLGHWKIKCSFLDYVQLLMIGRVAEWSEQITLTKTEKNEKGPLSHRKIICLFLDYVQLLRISRVIWAKNVDQKA